MRSLRIFLFLPLLVFSKTAPWSAGTAATIPAHRVEVGLFQPLCYGLTESVELSTFPLVNVLMPNLGLKKAWPDKGRLLLASEHSITCPTPLLRTLARDGAGGLLPSDAVVPVILTVKNQALVTKEWNNGFSLTGKAGIVLAARFGDMNMPTIDYANIFPRTAVYHSGYIVNAGVDFNGVIRGPFAFLLDADLFLTGLDDGAYAIEHKGLFIWNKSHRFRTCAGYKVIFGEYPFGTQLDVMPFYPLPVPVFDLQWGFR
ncbi:MAG: hypothetical protein A2487_07600 [Candidatus Raymondbacteria bacterium RifOxyC12_full_50_8]|uniref:Uncharacterized protein n=1 Tax=Candidatus Raymondbacteria bacterium RIFOXYD12_FULL_49_13 TaxID=1817890 RepID=A0A1F7F6H9_UNCRA|nr:MAG: hypothetical protein A2248_13350 [Candidatus Raymondbacteria bacterium RIFOXYA2_FULL_49_16]OGJ95400.1 MAG: hypothetical protein A2350_20965 [Candidatus Raymondbacteria bacterium RifOxyB12_full_50_8]OGJ99292.1 MAG: hypothetical protein A2487_07600 [Candidatus Raymondbacteria bacterium RifOxyC12_full_50_8]OGK02270.1 MAG: hypothetical protein A2519_16465 [Candidatus Raymondbacteria bacterium RIFOXYD12_FULL_49_13]OGP45116.1 MAG: hypothetical protein A2324_12005 [Candidatus Raymondbacteria b